jgi:hypothetical protein
VSSQLIMQSLMAVIDNLSPNSPQIAEISLGNPSFTYTAMFYDPYFPVSPAGSLVPLPGNIWLLAIRNISSVPIKITLVQSSTVIFNIGPNGVFIICDTNKAGAGFNLLALQSTSSGSVSAMVLVAA